MTVEEKRELDEMYDKLKQAVTEMNANTTSLQKAVEKQPWNVMAWIRWNRDRKARSKVVTFANLTASLLKNVKLQD